MSSFQTALAVFGAVIALALLLGGLYVTARSGLERKTGELWEQNAKALEAKVERLEDDLKISQTNELSCQQRLASAEGSIKTLQEVVSGTQAIAALEQVIEAHHQEVTSLLKKVTDERRR